MSCYWTLNGPLDKMPRAKVMPLLWRDAMLINPILGPERGKSAQKESERCLVGRGNEHDCAYPHNEQTNNHRPLVTDSFHQLPERRPRTA